MKRILMWLLVAMGVLVLCGFAVMTLMRLSETRSEVYERYAEAEAAGLFQRGWGPAFVLPSAGAITVVYDLDTNDTCARIQFEAADVSGFRASLDKTGYVAVDGEPPALPRFVVPRTCPFTLSEAASGDLFQGAGSSYASLDGSNGVLYAWTFHSD